jgi:hypothetical protein
MVIQFLPVTMLIKLQVVEIFEVVFNDHGVALYPFFCIAFPLQVITPRIRGIDEIYPIGFHLVNKQSLLCIKRLVRFLNPGCDLPDTVAGNKQHYSREYETMHS